MAFTGIDFETAGSRDLKKVGLDNYINDPQFRPLICSIAYRDSNNDIMHWTWVFIGSMAQKDRFNFETYILHNQDMAVDCSWVAHNAGFERAVLKQMQLCVPLSKIIDSAVIGRCMGADSSLAQAAPQLLNRQKMPEGVQLINKFCKPRKDGTFLVDDPDWDMDTDPDWALFIEYCERDAELSLLIAEAYANWYGPWRESVLEPLTAQMNQLGWPVDLEAVRWMMDRMELNKAEALATFRRVHDPDVYVKNKRGIEVLAPKLNLNSLPQLKAWCKERGVVAKSFDEAHVNEMYDRVAKKLLDQTLTKGSRENYEAVYDMLWTKRVMGGSSLTKLPVILNLVGEDGRLRNQYMHCGAGQSYRTSGTGVQMQNLKRLSTLKNMAELPDLGIHWTNDELAENIRQCFVASHAKGALVVGDLASVESRGLAYLAGAVWKTKEFADGKDMYKVLASKIFTVPYDAVTKQQRQTGKVGELSCGYGAGPVAVSSFAKGMGIEMDEQEALQLVRDWRESNPEIVNFWDRLDGLLHRAVKAADPFDASLTEQLEFGLSVNIMPIETPPSLQKQHPGARSLQLSLWLNSTTVLQRVFHGCYERGRNVCYYKPESNKGGKLWKGSFIDKNTKKLRWYDIYGGKLAGILTQSFCREIFFDCVERTKKAMPPGVEIIGQFHDEIVLNWDPTQTRWDLNQVSHQLYCCMSDAGRFKGFPLDAEVKSDYRYIK